MKKILYGSLMLLALTSCSDSFLEEEMVSTITQDYLETEQGLDQLIVSSYNAERVRYGYLEGFEMFELGHDCAAMSGSADNNKFSPSYWSSTGTVGTRANWFLGFQSKQQSGFNINCFPIIDNCNKAISAIRGGTALGKYASDKDYAAQKLSEVLFNRDYLLYSLNTLFGDIPVSQESITAIPSNFNYPRVPSAQLYSMMISDLRYAVENLPESWDASSYGRITKYAAAHMLAKLYLQRYQGKDYGTSDYGRNSDGSIDNSNAKSYLGMLYKGTGTADLDSCIYYEDMVINSGKYTLEPNYADIFKIGLNDYTAEGSAEILLPGLWADGADGYRYGLRAICMLCGDYVNSKYGIPQYTWENETKGNGGYRNNDWGYDVFTDKINDSRYQGSFHLEYKTALMGGTQSAKAADLDYYAYNEKSNATYTWTEAQAKYFNEKILPTYKRDSWGYVVKDADGKTIKGADGNDSIAYREAVVGEHKMGTGDLACAYLENSPETAISFEEADAQPFVLYARWMKDAKGNLYYRPQIVASGNNYSFAKADGTSANFYGLENTMKTGTPTNTKYNDPNRSSYNSAYGTRDIPVLRYAEVWLTRACAKGLKGNFDDAASDINQVRERAAFKTGDTRAEVLARLYPGHEKLTEEEQQWPYEVVTDATKIMDVDATYWDGSSAKSKAEDYPAEANTDTKRFVEFIANEYAREFNEEVGPYYEFLHHAGIQAERVQWHSQMGSSASQHSSLWSTPAKNTVGTTGQTGQAKGVYDAHYTLKPFPKSAYLDLLTDENNVLLTDEAKAKYQNYGY